MLVGLSIQGLPQVAIRTEVFPQESNGLPVRTVSVFVQKGDKVQLADSTESTRLYNALNIYPGSIFNQTIVSMAVNRLCLEPNIKSANTDYSARNTALQNLQKNALPKFYIARTPPVRRQMPLR